MPTLLIISVIVFTIIQLPPGDFLSTKIMQLQESGDQTDLKQIDDLKQMFRYEDPVWKQYLRWMGVKWFTTFKPQDTGLIQGNMSGNGQAPLPLLQVRNLSKHFVSKSGGVFRKSIEVLKAVDNVNFDIMTIRESLGALIDGATDVGLLVVRGLIALLFCWR